jgi:hypothetical protein
MPDHLLLYPPSPRSCSLCDKADVIFLPEAARVFSIFVHWSAYAYFSARPALRL